MLWGGGVAGSAFVWYINKINTDLLENTILIEKGKTDDTRETELVEESIQILKEHFSPIPQNIFSSPPRVGIYYLDLDNSIAVYQKRDLWNIDREKFNNWIFSKAKSTGVNICNAEVQGIRKVDNGYKIKISFKNKQTRYLYSKYVIGADGAFSVIRRHLKPITNYYLGYQEWIISNLQFPEFMIFVYSSEISEFYSWVIPKKGFIVVGTTLLPDERKYAADKINLLKKKLQKLGYGDYFKGKCEKRRIDVCMRGFLNDVFLGQERILLIGEAAGLISPSTAEGVSFALRSAWYAANSIFEDDPLENYAKRCSHLIQEMSEKMKKLENLKNPEKRFEYFQLVKKHTID